MKIPDDLKEKANEEIYKGCSDFGPDAFMHGVDFAFDNSISKLDILRQERRMAGFCVSLMDMLAVLKGKIKILGIPDDFVIEAVEHKVSYQGWIIYGCHESFDKVPEHCCLPILPTRMEIIPNEEETPTTDQETEA